MSETNIYTYSETVSGYLPSLKLSSLPGWNKGQKYSLLPLAQGEYNMNFLLKQGEHRWVVRVNTGSQIGKTLSEQIRYEYETLNVLEPTGITPKVFMLDDSLKDLPYGVIIMEYLEGEKLDYTRDNPDAARLFANIHQLPIGRPGHLIVEQRPFSLTYERCLLMAPVYWNSPVADKEVTRYLKEVFAWAEEFRHKESHLSADPWHCIINTEVNNGNFIINRLKSSIHLVDWEKPLWGDPSQDLSHFRVPTTTLWKTDFRMSDAEKKLMMATYKSAIRDAHLRDTIEGRTRLRDPFNLLRGVSWCAMAWVKYQTGDHILRNADTLRKLNMYVDLNFLRSLFDPYLQGGLDG